MSSQSRRVRIVIGLDGCPITPADLPQFSRRWMARKKAIVVAAVRGGLLTMGEACERYALTVEEYLSWQAAVDRHGLKGLRTTKTQDYRSRQWASVDRFGCSVPAS